MASPVGQPHAPHEPAGGRAAQRAGVAEAQRLALRRPGPRGGLPLRACGRRRSARGLGGWCGARLPCPRPGARSSRRPRPAPGPRRRPPGAGRAAERAHGGGVARGGGSRRPILARIPKPRLKRRVAWPHRARRPACIRRANADRMARGQGPGHRRGRHQGRGGADRGHPGRARARAPHRPERLRGAAGRHRAGGGGGDRGRRAGRGGGIGVPSQVEFATGTVLVQREHPAGGGAAAGGARRRGWASRCSWTTTPTAPRWPRPSWCPTRPPTTW